MIISHLAGCGAGGERRSAGGGQCSLHDVDDTQSMRKITEFSTFIHSARVKIDFAICLEFPGTKLEVKFGFNLIESSPNKARCFLLRSQK